MDILAMIAGVIVAAIISSKVSDYLELEKLKSTLDASLRFQKLIFKYYKTASKRNSSEITVRVFSRTKKMNVGELQKSLRMGLGPGPL